MTTRRASTGAISTPSGGYDRRARPTRGGLRLTEFQSRFWDWFRDVRIGEDVHGRVRLEFGDQVKVFGHEEPIGEVLEELRRLDLKVK